MRLWIKDPLAVFAQGAERGCVVDGSVIAECVPRGAEPAAAVDTVFDASRHVLLPGLINTHHHFYQTLTRAHPAAINKALFPWLQALYPIWARLTPDALRAAVRLALVELLLSGCTSAADHHYLFPRGLENAVDIEVEEARALGIRMTVTRGSMNLSHKDGGLPPDSVVQDEETILDDSERVLKLFHDPKPGAMIQIGLAPCSPFSVTRRLMARTAELAARFDAPLHTHLCETIDEEQFCLEKYSCRPVDLLEETGWLHARTWLAHGIHFDCGEIARLGRHGVGVCHCATSNMMEAVRHALMIGRLRYGAGALTHLDALRWATQGSARCLGRSDIGAIAPGMQADLALFTLDEPRFSGAHDPLAALVLCGAHRADRVMVAGTWRVVDGQVVGVDMARLLAEHRKAAMVFA